MPCFAYHAKEDKPGLISFLSVFLSVHSHSLHSESEKSNVLVLALKPAHPSLTFFSARPDGRAFFFFVVFLLLLLLSCICIETMKGADGAMTYSRDGGGEIPRWCLACACGLRTEINHNKATRHNPLFTFLFSLPFTVNTKEEWLPSILFKWEVGERRRSFPFWRQNKKNPPSPQLLLLMERELHPRNNNYKTRTAAAAGAKWAAASFFANPPNGMDGWMEDGTSTTLMSCSYIQQTTTAPSTAVGLKVRNGYLNCNTHLP